MTGAHCNHQNRKLLVLPPNGFLNNNCEPYKIASGWMVDQDSRFSLTLEQALAQFDPSYGFYVNLKVDWGQLEGTVGADPCEGLPDSWSIRGNLHSFT
jgi:hypothetical protein